MDKQLRTVKLTEEQFERLIGILHDNRHNPDAEVIATCLCAQAYNRYSEVPTYIAQAGYILLPERRKLQTEEERAHIESLVSK